MCTHFVRTAALKSIPIDLIRRRGIDINLVVVLGFWDLGEGVWALCFVFGMSKNIEPGSLVE